MKQDDRIYTYMLEKTKQIKIDKYILIIVIKRAGLALRDWIFKKCVSIRNLSKVENDKIIVGFIAGTKTGIAGSSKILFEAMTEDSRFFPYLVYQESGGKNILLNYTTNICYRRDFTKIGLFLKTNIWITTHGDFGIPIDYKKYNQKRMELWHGIPFKGFLEENRKRISDTFNRASAVIVTSKFFKELFSEEWNVKKRILKDLGQPRTDILIKKPITIEKIKQNLGISQEKIIFYAPTHEQDENKEKELFPWESDETFNKIVSNIDEKTALIIRPHPYWKELITPFVADKIENDERVYYMPSNVVNETEKLIYISDVLITDWSSIYFDFLLMDKPTIFLDLPNPFKDNFLMKPEERIGYLCSNSNELLVNIDESINNIESYHKKYDIRLRKLKSKVYSNTDGRATERCIEEIINLTE